MNIRVVSNGRFKGTKIYNSDTNEEITNVKKFEFYVDAETSQCYTLLTVDCIVNELILASIHNECDDKDRDSSCK